MFGMIDMEGVSNTKLWEVEKLIRKYEDNHSDMTDEELGLLHNYHIGVATQIHVVLSKRSGMPEMDRSETGE